MILKSNLKPPQIDPKGVECLNSKSKFIEILFLSKQFDLAQEYINQCLSLFPYSGIFNFIYLIIFINRGIICILQI